jgi:hypothetical protein
MTRRSLQKGGDLSKEEFVILSKAKNLLMGRKDMS